MENNTIQALSGSTAGTVLCFCGLTLSVTSVQAIFALISTILGLILTVITFVSKVIIPLWKKIRKARADGKITPEETEDILNDTKNNIEDFKNNDLKN